MPALTWMNTLPRSQPHALFVYHLGPIFRHLLLLVLRQTSYEMYTDDDENQSITLPVSMTMAIEGGAGLIGGLLFCCGGWFIYKRRRRDPRVGELPSRSTVFSPFWSNMGAKQAGFKAVSKSEPDEIELSSPSGNIWGISTIEADGGAAAPPGISFSGGMMTMSGDRATGPWSPPPSRGDAGVGHEF